MSINQAKSHRLSLQRTSDGKTTVSIDIFGPIGNPLEGLPLRDKLLLLLKPYGSNERALMRAVKGLPEIARRAVAADILAARRELGDRKRSKLDSRQAQSIIGCPTCKMSEPIDYPTASEATMA